MSFAASVRSESVNTNKETANTRKESAEDRVLVTGASGYLGTHVVKLLLDSGYKVRGTVRNVKAEKVKHLHNLCPNAAHPLELVEADLTEKSCWKQAVLDCNYVIHVASPFPWVNPKTGDEVMNPAVNGTLSVLEACRDAGSVRRVVLTSSIIAICGTVGGNWIPYTEKDWANESKLRFYGQSKVKAERAAWEFIHNLPDDAKFELAVVNPAFIAGPTLHSTFCSSMVPVEKLMSRKMAAVPRFSLPVCDVRDVALAHLRCMKIPEANGERHIVYSGSIWLYELAKELDLEFRPHGYNVPTCKLPNCITSVYSLFNKELRSSKGAMKQLKLDNDRMKTVLNITPTPINKTFIDMAYSMIDQGFVNKTDKYTQRTDADNN